MNQHDTYQEMYRAKRGTMQDCLDMIEDGDMICLAGDCNQPWMLSHKLHTIKERVTCVQILKDRMGDFPYFTEPGMKPQLRTDGFFFSPPMTRGMEAGNVSFIPVDICDYGKWISEYRPCNVFIAAVTPMDENGNMQMGMSLMWEPECYTTCTKIILEVNDQLPRIRGGLEINIRKVDKLFESSYPLFEVPPVASTEIEDKIGEYVADLVPDGACIQLGIGGIPNAVAHHLMDKKDLGLHSEMYADVMADLIEAGVLTGARKNINRGLHIGSFFSGTRPLFDYVHSNPSCKIMPTSYVCDPVVIMQNNNQVSINTILEMDLTGQVCSESIGPRQFSGSGGAFCFAYGAMHAKGGKGILAFPSRSKKGVSKINPMLTQGAVVTIPRNYVDYIVTEYGVACMRARSVEERTKQLIAIAHPDVRDELTWQAKKLFYIV